MADQEDKSEEKVVEKSFGLNPQYDSSLLQSLFNLVKFPLERLLALHKLDRVYSEIASNTDQIDFLDKALRALGISYSASEEDLKRIPDTGGALVIANHPFGGVEGLILASMFRSRRPDYKIMANFLLERIPELRDIFIFVDPFGGSDSFRKNIGPLRDTIEWIKSGKLLGVFPAGTVSHLQLQKREITDPVWGPSFARIIRKTQAPVIPVFFDGWNGPLFQMLGLIHPRLRTIMLPHELLNKRNTTFDVSVGNPIPYERLAKFERDEDMLAYLRLRTYILRSRSGRSREKLRKKNIKELAQSERAEPIAAPDDPKLLNADIHALPPEQVLVESGEFLVFSAWAQQIPHVLHEIGRLREISFRAAHEGTGRSIDLDRFDNHYMHLFVWSKEKHQIVGAYRIGHTDLILREYGIKGLYTHTLFAYRQELLDQMGPALELGRSFVRLEYQRNYSPLLLLWKGIGHYTAMNPKYRMLFGPVSINSKYDSISRQLMVNFLEGNNFLPEFARQVKARNPLRNWSFKGTSLKETSTVVRDIEEVSELVREIEEEQTGVPVLLRQYLKVGGKLLGFNVDPDFGDVLDGLILVDLTKTEGKLLERYLGKDGAEAFLKYHNASAQHQSPTTPKSSVVDLAGRSGNRA